MSCIKMDAQAKHTYISPRKCLIVFLCGEKGSLSFQLSFAKDGSQKIVYNTTIA